MSLLEQLLAKAQVTGDVGEGLDKELEQALAEAHRLEGGALWLIEGCKGVSNLMGHIRTLFEEGKLEDLDGKQVFDLLSEWNRKAVECIHNFAELKKSEALVANGRVTGFRSALESVKKYHETATARVRQIHAAMTSEEEPPNEDEARESRRARAPGEHPGASPLDARRMEAMREELSPKKKSRRKGNSKKDTPPTDP